MPFFKMAISGNPVDKILVFFGFLALAHYAQSYKRSFIHLQFFLVDMPFLTVCVLISNICWLGEKIFCDAWINGWTRCVGQNSDLDPIKMKNWKIPLFFWSEISLSSLLTKRLWICTKMVAFFGQIKVGGHLCHTWDIVVMK